MIKKYHRHFIFSAIVVILLVAVRVYQAPAPTGAFWTNNLLSPAGAASSTRGNLQIDFFDVGQGDSELIIAPGGEQVLVDGGPDNKVVQKLGEYLPYSDRKIEYVILTHPHSDHVDGLVEVLKRYEVGEVIMNGASHTADDYREFLRLVKEKNIPTLIIDRPQAQNLAGLDFDFLEPTKSFVQVEPENLNDSSIVFKLTYESSTVMFTGDFENEEGLTAASSSTELKSDVLKVGHHGSTNANSKPWLEAVHPEYAVIEVGAGNSYGLPNYRTLYYLQQFGAQVFRTDQNSDIRLVSDGHAWKIILP